jgi:DNA-directed RNA polymerase subunit M/transcription elongation factor TFIIS
MRAEQKVAEKESNLFRCPHCGMRRCTYLEVQRRSLDEAPDYLCRCLNPQCGRRFTGR